MTWWVWAVCIVLALNAVLWALQVDKPREPITPLEATQEVVAIFALICVIIYLARH